jgi:hypothetical protein
MRAETGRLPVLPHKIPVVDCVNTFCSNWEQNVCFFDQYRKQTGIPSYYAILEVIVRYLT